MKTLRQCQLGSARISGVDWGARATVVGLDSHQLSTTSLENHHAQVQSDPCWSRVASVFRNAAQLSPALSK